MGTTQKNTPYKKKVAFLVAFVFFFFAPKVAFAQGVSLSVTPPILEVMVAPGKEASYDFIISSIDTAVIVSPQIVEFFPVGIEGESEESASPAPSFVSYNVSPIALGPGASSRLKVKFAPPEDAEEADYYLRLFFQTQELPTIGGSASFATVKIAANILLTVSKDGLPNKLASISKFSSPRIVDSFFPIIYEVEIQNAGRTFFKPIGKIGVTSTFQKDVSLDLAPQNILAFSSRKIPCIEAEDLVDCRLPGVFHIGAYEATLEFNADDTGKLYSQSVKTFAFPFSLLAVPLIFFFVYRLTLTLSEKLGRGNKDNK